MTNFALPSHVSKRWVVSVEASTGEVLSPADFEFFGAATAPGAGAVAMRSTPGESQTVLTLSPLGQAGTWHYSIFCRQKVTAVTWQVASGQISVTPSPCLAQPSFDPDPLLLTAMLDPKTLQVTVSLGDSVAATAAAAQQAAQAAADAQTSKTAAAQSASAALAAQGSAQTAAADAQTSKTAAAQSAAAALAAQGSAQTAAADAQDSKTAAAQSASEALAAQGTAQTAAADAQDSKTAAAQSADEALAAQGTAQTAAADAQTSQTAAAQSADEALAAQGKAQTAAADAQTSQSAAAQSAADAESSAALLGDAALQSGDNTFTGGNTFAGDVYGVLPSDFWAYTWCTTKEELYAACPDLLKKEMCCIALGPIKAKSGSDYLLPDNIKKAVIYFAGETSEGPLGKGLNDLTVIAPNAIQNTWCITGHNSKDISWKVIMPKREVSGSFGNWCRTKSAFIIAKNKIFENSLFAGPYGGSRNSMEELIAPLNVVETVSLSNYKVLKNVPVGFPHATSINLNSAVLNKESVLAILNALQPYDASTMATVPELTLGIDPALDGDEEINAAVLNAQEAVENGGKGWNVAVSGFTVTAGGGATMALRKPVYARRARNDEGEYMDNDGARWSVRYGNTVLENWSANEQLGYEEFPSLEAALELWQLSEFTPEHLTQN